MKELYPELGSTVTFIRSEPEGSCIRGEGVVVAILLDPRSRVMVQVKCNETDTPYNVDLMTVNASDEFMTRYEQVIKDVQEISKEGNDLVQKTVQSYNTQVDDIYNALLGAPVAVAEKAA